MIKRRFRVSDGLYRGWEVSPEEVDSDISVVRDFLEDVHKVCRTVWESDGETVTSEFICKELRPRVFAALSDCGGRIRRSLSAGIGNADVPPHLLEHFERKMSDLENDLSNRYEIEAVKLAKRESRGAEMTQLPVATPAVGPFSHAQDYRSVTVRGKTYALTSRQAQMIQILHGAYENGNPDMGVDYILEQLGTKNSRWQDTFKGNRNAKQALVKSGASKGTLRLNL